MLAARRVLAKATLLLVALWLGSDHPAQAGADDRFAGTWELVSFEIVSADGRATDSSLGHNPVGWIMYDGHGHMCVQIARPDRPSFSSPDGLRGGPDEERLAYESYIAYCGAYVVHEAEGFIVHHLALSLYPNWTGTDQKRFFQFSGEELTLTTPPFRTRGEPATARLRWQRAQ